MIAAEAGLAHDILESNVGCVRHRGQQRAPDRAVGRPRGIEHHGEAGALHHLGLVAVVEHGEASRYVGFEGKLLQQAGAQRVDGLNLQPARCFQRRGKQFACRFAQRHGRVRDAGVADRGIERVVVERDPVAERREHALGHVGGGRLGEGEAQDLFRRHAGEQQTDHALHQHMGLAGAGVGRHERGCRGIGCAGLRVTDGRRNGARSLHHSSSATPPAADHSLTRARLS